MAQSTGLTIAEIKKARGPAGSRWQKTAKGRVLWSQAGVAELEAELAKSTGASRAAAATQTRDRKVCRGAGACRAGAARGPPGEKYNPALPKVVWLPQCKACLFVPGMEVLASLRPGRKWCGDFEGNPAEPQRGRRMPRARGRW